MSTSTAFPDGLVDFILPQLSLSLRNHIIFSWAHLFIERTNKDPLITDIISTITALDFSSHRSINSNNFVALSNLPLCNLKHLDLSRTLFAGGDDSEILATISTSPVFDNLESLDLAHAEIDTLDDLLYGTNSFPKLTTLNLSTNVYVSIKVLFNTNKFRNLKHLDLSYCYMDNDDVKIMAKSTVSFQLESFDISGCAGIHFLNEFDPFRALFKASFMTNIKNLNLVDTRCDLAALSFLLDDQAGPFSRKGHHQLTHLRLHREDLWIQLNQKVICDLASSSIVSDLTHLSLALNYQELIDLGVLSKSKYLSNLKELKIRFHDNDPSSLAPLLCPGDDHLPHFRLEKLEIDSANLSREDIIALCTSPCLSTLKSLSLIDCRAQNGDTVDTGESSSSSFDWADAVELLSQSTIISKLTHLNLSWCCPSSFEPLLRSDLLSSDLIELNLEGNALDVECLEIITSKRVNEGDEISPFKFGKLQQLNLGRCSLTKGTLASISNLTELKHLDISFYDGGDGDDLIISLITRQDDLPFLPKLAHLTHLNLCHSSIKNSSVIALSQSQLLNGLVELDLSDNNLGNDGLEALKTTKLVSKLKALTLIEEELAGNLPYLKDCLLG